VQGASPERRVKKLYFWREHQQAVAGAVRSFAATYFSEVTMHHIFEISDHNVAIIIVRFDARIRLYIFEFS